MSEPDFSRESVTKAELQDIRDYVDARHNCLAEEHKKPEEPVNQQVKEKQQKKKQQVQVQEPLYSAGPWRGEVLDAEIKELLEGVLVADFR